MPFLNTVFGSKVPTSAAARQALAKHQADLAAAPGRIAAAEAALARVADMTAEGHAAAEAEHAEARRSAIRLEAQVVQLRAAVAEAEQAERLAALHGRREAARKLSAGMGKALDNYDRHAAATAEAAREIAEIDAEVAAVNDQIAEAKKAGLVVPDLIPTSAELFRSEPDLVEPARVVEEEEWAIPQADGRWGRAGIFVERDGETVPQHPSAERRKVKRTIPQRTRPGRRTDSLIVGLSLPASRLGREPHWPRPA